MRNRGYSPQAQAHEAMLKHQNRSRALDLIMDFDPRIARVWHFTLPVLSAPRIRIGRVDPIPRAVHPVHQPRRGVSRDRVADVAPRGLPPGSPGEPASRMAARTKRPPGYRYPILYSDNIVRGRQRHRLNLFLTLLLRKDTSVTAHSVESKSPAIL